MALARWAGCGAWRAALFAAGAAAGAGAAAAGAGAAGVGAAVGVGAGGGAGVGAGAGAAVGAGTAALLLLQPTVLPGPWLHLSVHAGWGRAARWAASPWCSLMCR
jgi:hypothetical protein